MLFRCIFIGFKHEHTRWDRDRYVTINYENIRDGAAYKFDKCKNCDLQQTPYDYNSIMHFGPKAFSKNWHLGYKTIDVRAINGRKQSKIGQRKGFSRWDIIGINKLYCSHRK